MSNDVIHTAIIFGDPLFREGLCRILEGTRYRVDVVAPSIAETMDHPDELGLLILLGFANRDSKFLDALAALRNRWPKARVVAIAENRADQLIAALNAGVHGYLVRHISAEALTRFLSLIVLGQRVFSTRSLDLSKHAQTVATDAYAMERIPTHRIDSRTLSAREQELLAFLVEGHSNKVIARELGIAEATVKGQMVKLFDKIGAANRTQAAVLAWTSHRASLLQSSRAPVP